MKLVLQLILFYVCSKQVKRSCDCTSESDDLWDDCSYQRLSSELNESQNNAIRDCLSGIHCDHNSTVKLIWGPPGTGKTKTLGTLLFLLLKMKYRILVCAPTNIAIKEIASRMLNIVRESLCGQMGDLFCSPGDMLLFGNNDRLDVRGEDIEDIFLDNRVQQLRECLSTYTGWRHCFESMISLLNSCVSDYHVVENEMIRMKRQGTKGFQQKSFREFLRERFHSRALQLKDCISMLCTHVPMGHILEHNYRYLVCLNEAVDSFQETLFQDNLTSDELKTLFSNLIVLDDSSWYFENGAAQKLIKKRNEFLSALEIVKHSLDRVDWTRFTKDESIRDFCFENSSIIFCTTSTSFRLHKVSMKPMNLLVIDEASQLKECESILPLQLPGINHAILVGDECQLSSMVRSNVSIYLTYFAVNEFFILNPFLFVTRDCFLF